METFDEYFAAVSKADAAAAVGVVSEAVDRGVPPERIVRDVLARAQAKAGQLWFEGAWNVADEHAASGVTEQALTTVAPPAAAAPGARKVVLACAEGEWHTLPARLAGALARSDRVDVVMLGGSIPAEHLGRHLAAIRPSALALSVTLPTNLIGSARSIEVAHAEGVPVIAGGAAWGGTQHRAQRLGADLYLDDPAGLAAAVDIVAVRTDVPPVPQEALMLDAVPSDLLRLALELQCAANAWMDRMSPYQRARSLEDLRWMARHAAAAVACDDPTIVRGLLDWLVGLLEPRGVPVDTVVDSCYFLADTVEHAAPLASDVLRREANLAHERLWLRRRAVGEP